MIAEIFDRIGELNPQFYREIKGRFKRRNLILTVILSLTLQFFCVLPSYRASYRSAFEDNWWLEWNSIFPTLNWLLPFSLLVIGVYLLSSDLSREQQRGTLNFVRLSPQTSESILLGKLLGVPILLYLGVALAIPLHLKAGIAAGVPWGRIFGVYPLWGLTSVLFYGTTLLMSLLLNGQGEQQKSVAGANSLLALMAAPTFIGAIEYAFYAYDINSGANNWTWFFLPFGTRGEFTYLWLLGTLCAVNYWIWQAANRRFRNPNLTLLSKSQSYWIVGCTQLWLLGFVMPALVSVDGGVFSGLGLFFLFIVAPLEILMLASLLSPDRQTLLDWTRYRHWQGRRDRALLKDLLLGEKSPAVAAIALNLAITALIWLPWILLLSLSALSSPPDATFSADDPTLTRLGLFFCLLMTANIFLIYATINQLVRFYAKTPKQAIAIALPWGGMALFPLIIAGIFRIAPEQLPLLWLFSPVPIVGVVYASVPILLLGFLGQLGILTLLVRQLQKQLMQAGESESNKLFAERLT
jgi:ABC-type transport system involved in multi-copper enzyme maturation permease subunit